MGAPRPATTALGAGAFLPGAILAELEYHPGVCPPSAQPPEGLDELMRLVRLELRDEPEQASAIVNRWFDEHIDRYPDMVLAAELGTHQDHFDIYRLLTTERRVELVRRAVARCLAEQRSGLEAGAFMIGRFLSTPHPVAFWNELDDGSAAFGLNEWVLYLRYLSVLDQVGERRLQLARQVLRDGPLPEIRLTPGDAKVFVPLKLSARAIDRLAELSGPAADPMTAELLGLLRQPYRFFYDFAAPWSVGELRRTCEQAGRPVPGPDDR